MNTVELGDSLEILRRFQAESVDLIATDPPYGYSFMGKDWDKAVPPVDLWRECLRVLKHGAFAFVMSSPRQDVLSQMIVRLSEAGFNTGFSSIYWAYASGFPKAMNIGKAVDKKLGVESTRVCQKKLNPRDKKVYTPNTYAGLRGTRTFERNPNMDFITAPSSAEGKSVEGSYGGFQPKPAVEVILVCMKPLSAKTFVDQALANGKGVTWLDAARIPITSREDLNDYEFNRRGFHERADLNSRPYEGGWKPRTVELGEPQGRFPANLLVSDDILNDGTITESKPHLHDHKRDTLVFGGGKGLGIRSGMSEIEDVGSFSRYFDLDRWFAETIKKLPKEGRETFPFLITPKASKGERNEGLDRLPEKQVSYMSTANGTGEPWQPIDDRTGKQRDRFKVMAKNHHPTVKPLALMSYLITLGSRPKDLILDPFVGSGTTCIAAKMLGRHYIGIDNNPEYVKIAEARLNSFQTLDVFSINTNCSEDKKQG